MSTSTDTKSATSRSASNGRSTAAENLRPSRDVVDYVREYAKQKPDVAAMWCFGLGIYLGWKIKPW